MFLAHIKNKYILYDDMGRVIISTSNKRIIKTIIERIHNGRLADDIRGEKPEQRQDKKRQRSKQNKGDEEDAKSTTNEAEDKSE